MLPWASLQYIRRSLPVIVDGCILWDADLGPETLDRGTLASSSRGPMRGLPRPVRGRALECSRWLEPRPTRARPGRWRAAQEPTSRGAHPHQHHQARLGSRRTRDITERSNRRRARQGPRLWHELNFVKRRSGETDGGAQSALNRDISLSPPQFTNPIHNSRTSITLQALD